jgi:toxin ParE1/3/4
MKIIWSDTALKQLEDLYDYYKLNASVRVARNISKTIVEASLQLNKSPLIGTKEPLLQDRKFEYRYIVVKKNYKLIYRIDSQIIFVISVFDCRQNPIKLENLSE